jgi:hypothetical protein
MKVLKKKKFKTTLEKIGSWTIAPITFDAAKHFGTKSHVRVKGSINGIEFKGKSLMPFGQGKHFLTVPSALQKKIRKRSGDEVTIEIEQDYALPEIPAELTEALQASEEASEYFEECSPSHKRSFARYISESMVKETREKRAVKMVLKMEQAFLEKKKILSWEKK